MKEMILASNQAKIILSQSDNQEIRAFLKNIGSNFILKDKKIQFALKIGWRALAEGEPTKTFPNWRRERDSNPRGACAPTCFQDRRFQPLSHPSISTTITNWIYQINGCFSMKNNYFICIKNTLFDSCGHRLGPRIGAIVHCPQLTFSCQTGLPFGITGLFYCSKTKFTIE